MKNETWVCRRKRRAFTLVEILLAVTIASIVFGATILLMGQGIRISLANVAYSVAQRGALSSIEFLPKDIAYAGQVEIITDPAHAVTDDLLSQDWRYILRNGDKVFHIYWDKGRKSDSIPGSEFITDLKFGADVFSPDRYPGGRVLRCYVQAENDSKKVALDRSYLLRTPSGAVGEGNASIDASFTGGPILRYRSLPADPAVKVEMFGSMNAKRGEQASFDYANPDTWSRLKEYSYTTKMDAVLQLPEDLYKQMEPDSVVFTWIAASPDVFAPEFAKDFGGDFAKDFPKLPSAEKQKKLLAFLKKRIPSEELENVNLMRVSLKELFENRSDLFEKGKLFRVLEIAEGVDKPEKKAYAMKEPDYFDLGSIVNMVPCPDAYVIVVAHYKTRDGAWNMAPAFVELDAGTSGRLMEMVLDTIRGGGDGSEKFFNTHGDFGAIRFDGTGKAFTVYGKMSARQRGPQVLLKLTEKDFQHLKPKNPEDPDLYGVTNYTLYFDGQLTYTGSGKTVDGGYGILLNGSGVQSLTLKNGNASVREHLSSGYMFQLDPGAGGYPMRYLYYTKPTLENPTIDKIKGSPTLSVYNHDAAVSFGVHPLYSYDASKAYHNLNNRNLVAPQTVSFFASSDVSDPTVLTEDFNANVGIPNPAQWVFYRMPFLPENAGEPNASTPHYIGDMANPKPSKPIPLLIFTRGRNKIGVSHYKAYGGPFGMTYGGGNRAVYNPKQTQTWHLYYKGTDQPDTNVVLNFPTNVDTRKGYRWDMDRNDTSSKSVPIVWNTRHIIKLTVLEVTRDIYASEVAEEWRGRIHHDGSTDLGYSPKDVIHQAGDLFVRMEMGQLRNMNPATTVNTDIYDSRNYIFSKPLWYGKFKGDAWRGNSPSPFKKMGNSMMHIVTPPEPEEGDSQSFRHRRMRVRSWKDTFRGWDFANPVYTNKGYAWKDDLIGKSPVHPDLEEGADKVWTPPVAIDLKGYGVTVAVAGTIKYQTPGSDEFGRYTLGSDGKSTPNGNAGFVNDIHSVYQWGDRAYNTFGNYAALGQKVQFERRRKDPDSPYVYGYNGYYDDKIYGRLSLQRPYGNNVPIYGLYALRGWDYLNINLGPTTGTANPVNDHNTSTYGKGSVGYPSKRFLMVAQGLQMPYQPSRIGISGNVILPNLNPPDYYRRAPENTPDVVYRKNRDRVFGLRFWGGDSSGQGAADASNPNQFKFYDMWIEEGFSPKEVRAILGLDPKQFPDSTLNREIPKLYDTKAP
ncbi:MAG: type II secretion system GspH family protein [Synergistaceae bacterium]|nr:type II secretion system GspH family protein [Synergistaceae bacterium]